MILGLAALVAAGLSGSGHAAESDHPAALSRLTIRFAEERMHLEFRIQELTLREVPSFWLDTDNDGRYSTREVEAAWPQVNALLKASSWFELDGVRYQPEWRISGFEDLSESLPDGGTWFDHFTAEADLPPSPGLGTFSLHSDIFLDQGNAEHRLHLRVEGVWDEPTEDLLGYAHRDWTLTMPSTWRVLRLYTELGFEHVLNGRDHLGFVAALLLGVGAFGSLLAAITAFTLAHSITLALAGLGILRLPPAVVEPAISWSVLLVAVLHLRLGPARARAWIPAFLFGLLHGCGFAGALGDIGLPSAARVTGLLGFNLGVEGGQLAFVLPVVLLGALLRRLAPAARPGLWQAAQLVVLAFALHLVGDAVLAWWVAAVPGVGVAWSSLIYGSIAAAATVGLASRLFRQPADGPPLRGLLLQAGLLVTCYTAGIQLSGFGG